MNLLSADNLARRIGERTLFAGLSLGIERGQKIGLVARNGAGKSTLLSILAGATPPDAGVVTLRGGLRLAFLEQDPRPPAGKTILEWCLDLDHPAIHAGRRYEAAAARGEPHALQAAMEEMDRVGGWDFAVRARQQLDRVGLPDPDRPAGVLSGGERKRAALARVLIDEPQLLLLDEPTNHLDLDLVEWLEERLQAPELAILMVTHDRWFLERVAGEILELTDGKLFRTRGSYGFYLEQRAKRLIAEEKAAEREATILEKELYWFSRQPKARGGRSRHRKEELEERQREAGRRMGERELQLAGCGRRLGKQILELENVARGFAGRMLFRGLTYRFRRGERLGIVGPNGTGKTSLVRLLTGQDAPDEGKVTIGANTVTACFGQITPAFDGDKRVLDIVRAVAEVYPLGDGRELNAAQMLERFLFPAHTHGMPAKVLSGGEKRRLYLLTVLFTNPNFLILDEPTNDLDLLTLSVLEDFLEDFGGCLVIVSHDRYLLDRLVDHLFILDGEGMVTDFTGNWSLWRDRQANLKAEALAEGKIEVRRESVPASKRESRQRSLTWAEAREFEALEPAIEELGREAADLEAKVDGGLDYREMAAASARLEALRREIEVKTERWLELAAVAEAAGKG